MDDIPKAYNAKEIESKWYSYWREKGLFKANPSSDKEPFCIIMPPPNVTGVLHMGHALDNTLQDILIRYHRMKGKEVLWVPGTDHAGIATQTVVEKDLMEKTGKRRRDFSRDKFLHYMWRWKEEKESNILQQIQKLGCSCDWSYLRFTLDKQNSSAVRTIFKAMYDEGLIYQGDYLVNWDPMTQTALADDEVEYEERESFLWYLRYPYESDKGYLIVATTRPETMLGDVAVAVSPDDPRFTSLVGSRLILPLTDRKIPIIADHFVDPDFGSGIVKVTPAHDFADYEVGLRHGLEPINILTPDGLINEKGGKFEGLTVLQARKAVVAEMKKLNLIEKVEPYKVRIGISYRSKATIEPYLSKQWFIKMTAFKDKLTSIVKEKKIKLIPSHWEHTYFHWIENLRDWCISRQIWWGHRIPIWYEKNHPEHRICYAGEGLPPEVEKEPEKWYQDEDVLDTWFSSALLPFSFLGWPDKSLEFKKFYPTAILITGHDILFFWVARMILMGEYATKKVPFRKVFIHGLIYSKSYWRMKEHGFIAYVEPQEREKYDRGEKPPKDVFSKWEKMSKSKGNVIDPTEIIDLYGTDAIRMTLCSMATGSAQLDLDRKKFDEFKNFANKIWNAARFVFLNLERDDRYDLIPLTSEQLEEGIEKNLLDLEDKWILTLLNKKIKETDKNLQNLNFDKMAKGICEFFWDEFCAYYLEVVKVPLLQKEKRTNKQKLLTILLCNLMRLIHPVAPFITEEIFQRLRKRFAGATLREEQDEYTVDTIRALHSEGCIVAPFPEPFKTAFEKEAKDFEHLKKIIYALRNIRAEMQLAPKEKINLSVLAHTKEKRDYIEKRQNIITSLIKIEKLTFVERDIKLGSTAIVDGIKLIVSLPQEFLQKEKKRLEREKEKLEQEVSTLVQRLENKEFLEKAPKEIITKIRKNLRDNENKLKEINRILFPNA